MQAHVRATPSLSASCEAHVREHVLVQTNIKTATFYLQLCASSYEHGHVLVQAHGPGHVFMQTHINLGHLYLHFYDSRFKQV